MTESTVALISNLTMEMLPDRYVKETFFCKKRETIESVGLHLTKLSVKPSRKITQNRQQ